MSDKTVEVVAIERGHDGDAIREVGETFHVDIARLKEGSTWFVEAGSAEAAAVKPEPATGAGRSKK